MAWWERKYGDDTAHDAENFAYPPGGGPIKLVLLGILLPLGIAAFAASCWISEKAVWFGGRGGNMDISGPAARAMAVAYLGGALFCHFRWCWGLRGHYRVFEVGTVIALLTLLGGGITSFYHVFF